jgi:hypothetical protein
MVRKQMASCPSTDSLALPCLETWGSEFMLPNHRRYLIPSRPDPAPSQDTDASPAVVLSCTPHLPKSTSPTGNRIVTSRHEASKTLIPLEIPVAHPPHTPSQTPQIKKKKGP